jgi:carboxylesterase type B
LFPAIVFIHGGGFATGSAVAYNNFTDIGRRYVQKGIVTVAIQYRLSVLGKV